MWKHSDVRNEVTSAKKCFKNKCKCIQSPNIVLMYIFCWDGARKIRLVVTYKGNEMLDARDKRSVSDMLGLFVSASLLLLLEDSNNNSYFIG